VNRKPFTARMMRDRGQRTVAQVADDLGVEAGHLHRWAKKFDQEIVAKRNPQGETLEEEIGGCARRTNGCEWRRPY